jgi:hypothetical protein
MTQPSVTLYTQDPFNLTFEVGEPDEREPGKRVLSTLIDGRRIARRPIGPEDFATDELDELAATPRQLVYVAVEEDPGVFAVVYAMRRDNADSWKGDDSDISEGVYLGTVVRAQECRVAPHDFLRECADHFVSIVAGNTVEPIETTSEEARMKIGTKSVLFGAHQFLIHPIILFIAWLKEYGVSSVLIGYRLVWVETRLNNRESFRNLQQRSVHAGIWDPRLWVAFFVHDLGYWQAEHGRHRGRNAPRSWRAHHGAIVWRTMGGLRVASLTLLREAPRPTAFRPLLCRQARDRHRTDLAVSPPRLAKRRAA